MPGRVQTPHDALQHVRPSAQIAIPHLVAPLGASGPGTETHLARPSMTLQMVPTAQRTVEHRVAAMPGGFSSSVVARVLVRFATEMETGLPVANTAMVTATKMESASISSLALRSPGVLSLTVAWLYVYVRSCCREHWYQGTELASHWLLIGSAVTCPVSKKAALADNTQVRGMSIFSLRCGLLGTWPRCFTVWRS